VTHWLESANGIANLLHILDPMTHRYRQAEFRGMQLIGHWIRSSQDVLHGVLPVRRNRIVHLGLYSKL
jgi:hypothetical protein